MARLWKSSAPRLLYYTLRSSTTAPPPPFFHLRHFSNEPPEHDRNIWISSLIDPSKTTLEEREDFYTGHINRMDKPTRKEDTKNPWITSLGFNNTIQSTITFLTWNNHNKITVIDTSDSVDFTVDNDRVLRVVDSSILVICGVNGVQSQSITMNQLMNNYQLPRIVFINNIDEKGACPLKIMNDVRSKLHYHSAVVQIPIGFEDCFDGVVDLVKLKAYYFDKSSYSTLIDVREEEICENMSCLTFEKRRELIETVSEVDDELAEAFRSGKFISGSELEEAIRRATIAKKFVPVFMGCALRNYGLVHLLLDGVVSYLPSPIDVCNYAFDQTKNGEKVQLSGNLDGPLVALAFTMEHRRLSQLTYLRIYQGVLRKGDFITNVNTGERIKVPRLFRRHYHMIKDVEVAHAGQIVAVFGADCASGDTFTDGSVRYTMTPVKVPDDSVSEDNREQFQMV